MTKEDAAALAELDTRLNTVLPEEYQGVYDGIEPVPMGAAGLRFDADGRVAWDEIWGSFCDLAMAGGPPHKGKLLEPGSPEAIAAAPDRYAGVVKEIVRGIRMVTGLEVEASPDPGWIQVHGLTETMAGWLQRAIAMENVAVRAYRATIELPAGPDYRLEKEIKNVVTVIAKTSHYWEGHMPFPQRRDIGRLFAELQAESPLVVPAAWVRDGDGGGAGETAAAMASAIAAETELPVSARRYAGWLGVEAPSVRSAVWMMRALVVSNVLARREDTILFVPVPAAYDPDGRRVVRTLARVHHLAGLSTVRQ